MRFMVVVFILIAGVFFISATGKLREKYAVKGGYENFYLTFLNKTDFELEMYSCLYQIKMNGSYKTTKDTVYLVYEKYQTLDDDRKNWIPMDSAQIEYEQNFLKIYSKLIREDRDKILRTVDTRMRRAFRDVKEPYSEYY